MDNLSRGFLSTVIAFMIGMFMFVIMFKILCWHQFLVTSATAAVLDLVCDLGCFVNSEP